MDHPRHPALLQLCDSIALLEGSATRSTDTNANVRLISYEHVAQIEYSRDIVGSFESGFIL
jgi:hypothetical protein